MDSKRWNSKGVLESHDSKMEEKTTGEVDFLGTGNLHAWERARAHDPYSIQFVPDSERTPRLAMRQDAYELFREVWSLLDALHSYVDALKQDPSMPAPEREAAEEMNRLLSRLEDREEELRSRVLALLG